MDNDDIVLSGVSINKFDYELAARIMKFAGWKHCYGEPTAESLRRSAIRMYKDIQSAAKEVTCIRTGGLRVNADGSVDLLKHFDKKIADRMLQYINNQIRQ